VKRTSDRNSDAPGSAASAASPVHEVVLDHRGELNSVRGVPTEHVPARLDGLLEVARKAGQVRGQHELSFHWRSGDGRLIFATVRTRGHDAGRRTSLSWTDHGVLPYGVTSRELDVLTLLIGGLSNTEIATRLSTSTRTVSTHVERVLAKLSLRSRAAAVGLALEESLFVLPVPGGTEGFERLLMGVLSAPETPAPPQSTMRALNTSPPLSSGRRDVRRPILLGGAFPLTGEAAEDGREMLQATKLAITEINSRGGIAGRSVELVAVDLDIKDSGSISTAFNSLTAQDVDALVSGYLGHQEVAHDIAAGHHAPYLHAATLDSMARLVADDPVRYGNVFQICPSDINYGPGFVDAMTYLRDSGQLDPGNGTLAVVRGRWKHGDLGLRRAVELAERSGWTLAYASDDVNGEDAWRAEGRTIAALAPTAVLIGSYFVDETVRFIREFQRSPSPTVLYSLYAPSIPRFRVEMGPQAEGVLWATTTGTYSDQVARRFAARYRREWAVSPGRSHAGIAYDRVRILAAAWAAADSPRDFESVAEALRSGVHRGVNGAYSFAEAEQAALAYPLSTADPSIAMAHLVFQIQDNRQRIVYPSPYTEASYRRPPWWPS
jgi:branched-chain amino acid transport system substrate-binding protein